MSHYNAPHNTSKSLSAAQIDDPQTLSGLFPPDSDDETDGDGVDDEHGHNHNLYEIQTVELVGNKIRIRQYDYHSHNANRVWPGSFPLSEYLLEERSTTSTTLATQERTSTKYVHQWGRVLELGTATGLLAIRLAMACRDTNRNIPDNDNDHNTRTVDDTSNNSKCDDWCCTSVVTSDVDDEYGDVASNLLYNYSLNHMTAPLPYHVPHTWGTGFNKSIQKVIEKEATNNTNNDGDPDVKSTSCNHPLLLPFDTIIASDILLYVSSYPALVETLSELMIPPSKSVPSPSSKYDENENVNNNEATRMSLPEVIPTIAVVASVTATATAPPVKFIMSWNRRLKESKEFFERMNDAGFIYEHHGKGIYTFVYDQKQQRM